MAKQKDVLKVKDLKKFIDRVDPEAEVFANLKVGLEEEPVVAASLAFQDPDGWVHLRSKRAKKVNALVLYVRTPGSRPRLAPGNAAVGEKPRRAPG